VKATFGHGEYFGNLGGGQSEFCVVPLADHTLEQIPEGMSDDKALFVGDILSTAFFGAERAEIKPGDTVAVVGAGPVGLLAVMAAQLFGPARVFAIDMVDSRLEVAQGLGAIPINANETHPVEAIKQATGDHGVDASIECVGLIPAVQTAIECVRGGGTISMVGVPSKALADFPYLHVWLKDLTFRAGWCNVQAYMRPMLDLIQAGRIDPASIISHRMALDDGVEAYRLFAAREATKVVLTP
jgi:threonine dehydrogenase-like Zn-dependent dehydrogenase